MEEFSELVLLMQTLRGEKGCPWDKRRTIEDFKTFLLEEVYELIEAIESHSYEAIKEELGDLLFHVIFISEICREDGKFEIKDVLEITKQKIIRRHPHVFLNKKASEPIPQMWEEIKRKEKKDYSPLDAVPKFMPSLLKAYIVGKRASRIGFDWERVDDVYAKMEEEIKELKEAEKKNDKEKIREEVGDLLFTVVNISRFYEIDPEDALRATIEKFIRRFSYIEKKINGKEATLDDMNQLWEEMKKKEKEGE